jgi:hypothetical protein
MSNRNRTLFLILAAVLFVGCRTTPARDAATAAPAVIVDSAGTEAPPPTAQLLAGEQAPERPLEAAPPTPTSAGPITRAPQLREPVVPTLPGAAPDTLPGPLRELRAALDDARSASDEDHLSTGGEQPLDMLVGMTRSAIRAALGSPNTCAEDAYTDADGQGHPVAPCVERSDWFYSFYHLPEGWVGGGPELLLHFDGSDFCTTADWRFTQ